MSESLSFNPFAYEMHEDPYPTYERLREEEPCYQNEEMGFWVLSRFDDVLEGYRDWENFTSTRGIALEEVGTESAPSMIGMDPLVQTKLRKLVVRAFNPRRVGFWFAQQGSIYVFVALIFFYARRMAALDRDHGVSEE